MEFPVWAKNILFLLVFMISGLLLVIVIEGLSSGNELLPFNTVIEETLVGARTPVLTTLMVFATRIGTPFLLLFAAVVIAAYFLMKRDLYRGCLILAAMAIAVISLHTLKNTFQVVRPASDLYAADGWSFPSGHTTMATTFFFLLAHTFWSRVKTVGGKVLLTIGVVAGTLAVAVSRLYLGVHWGLDVLGGISLGLLSVSFTVLVFNLIPRRWLKVNI